MTHEAPRLVEQEPRPRFDAVLVHAYWLSDGSYGLSLRSRLAVRAAARLYDEGRGVGKIVLTAGRIWGEDYPSLGQLMKEELMEKYAVPSSRILVLPEAKGTSHEIDLFLEQARTHGWTNLVDISAAKHKWSIPETYRRKGQEAAQESYEDILKRTEDNPHMQKLLSRLHIHRSRYEASYAVYQGLTFLLLHLNMEKLKQTAEKVRVEKGQYVLPLPVLNNFPVDPYKLEESFIPGSRYRENDPREPKNFPPKPLNSLKEAYYRWQLAGIERRRRKQEKRALLRAAR